MAGAMTNGETSLASIWSDLALARCCSSSRFACCTAAELSRGGSARKQRKSRFDYSPFFLLHSARAKTVCKISCELSKKKRSLIKLLPLMDSHADFFLNRNVMCEREIIIIRWELGVGCSRAVVLLPTYS